MIQPNPARSSNSSGFRPGEEAVLQFFLNLFKIQIGLSEEDSVEAGYRPHERGGGREHTYELFVRGIKKKTRRMAISPLGENSGAKSRCYKVIYDDILVVKIPPVPIRNFDAYIEAIRVERSVADRLMPSVECIAPSLSALLRKVPAMNVDADLAPEALEAHFVDQLKKSPWMQDYLKIDGAFAFFMNLSQYGFLGHVIESMHNLQGRFQEEVFSQFDILWNLMAFESNYGSEKSPIFFAVNEMFNEYEDRVNGLFKRHGLNAAIFMYKKKEWFLLHLAEGEVPEGERNLPRGLPDQINRTVTDIFRDRAEDVRAYRKMMRAYVYDKMFNQNRPQCRGILANLVELLHWLGERGVAIRDLKPDNIFVVGGSFLHNAGDFSLGLIDFETAVNFRPGENEGIAQPPPAGTPSYATPSHLARNEVLAETLGDLARVFFFQDWQAVMCMAYYVVTGNRLFDRTRHRVGEVWRRMRAAGADTQAGIEAFRESSRDFWASALYEFGEKMRSREQTLRSVEVVLTDNGRELLLAEAVQNRNHLLKQVQQLVKGQKIFVSDKSHRDLVRAPHQIITRCRKNWEDGVNVPQSRPEIRDTIIRMLSKLESLKLEAERRLRLIRLLEREVSSLTALDLMDLMFRAALGVMYRDAWGELDDPSVAPVEGLEGDGETVAYDGAATPEETISYEQTISYEETVPYEETVSFESNPGSEGGG
jgi:serine/threonine protein kinase